MLPTILSRCQRFDFRRIPLDALERHLGWIAQQEAIEIQPEAIHVVAQRSQGGLRDAESLLDQLSLLPPPIEATAVWDLLGAVPEQELLELVNAMRSAEPVELLEAARNLLDRGRDPGAVLQGLAGILRDLVLMAAAPDRPELTGCHPNSAISYRPWRKPWARPVCCSGRRNCEALNSSCARACSRGCGWRCCCWACWRNPTAQHRSSRSTRSTPNGCCSSSSTPAGTAIIRAGNGCYASSCPSRASQLANRQPRQPKHPLLLRPQKSLRQLAGYRTSLKQVNLPELWQQILGSLELPSTRMLLSQQGQLVRLDANRRWCRRPATGWAWCKAGLPCWNRPWPKPWADHANW